MYGFSGKLLLKACIFFTICPNTLHSLVWSLNYLCVMVCVVIRVRARALTALASAANSTQNMELNVVVKELVLPHHGEDKPMETNGTYVCMCLFLSIYVIRMYVFFSVHTVSWVILVMHWLEHCWIPYGWSFSRVYIFVACLL